MITNQATVVFRGLISASKKDPDYFRKKYPVFSQPNYTPPPNTIENLSELTQYWAYQEELKGSGYLDFGAAEVDWSDPGHLSVTVPMQTTLSGVQIVGTVKEDFLSSEDYAMLDRSERALSTPPTTTLIGTPKTSTMPVKPKKDYSSEELCSHFSDFLKEWVNENT